MATKKQIEHAWDNAKKIKGRDPDLYRKDPYGNEIYKPSYGKTGEKSWEIDHKNPKAKGGTDILKNIEAVQWEGNRKKSNKYPYKKK